MSRKSKSKRKRQQVKVRNKVEPTRGKVMVATKNRVVTTDYFKLFEMEKEGSVEFIQDLREALESLFEVVLIAPMSAGKSTLINAFLGQDLLPTSNQACTAKIFKIVDDDSIKHIRCRQSYGEVNGNWQRASKKLIREWNSEDSDARIEIRGNLPFIRNFGAKLAIYDTPGPNYWLNKNHGEVLYDTVMKKEFGATLFLLNANNLATNDEKRILEQLLHNNKNDPDIYRKLIYVISKADQIDEERGECLSEITERTADYLKTSFGIEEANIIPIMGKAALLGRKLVNNKYLTKSELFAVDGYLKSMEVDPKRILRATKLRSGILKKIEEGIDQDTKECRTIHRRSKISPNNIELTQVTDFSSLTRKQLDRFLYSTGLHTLELYFEHLISTTGLKQIMDQIKTVFEYHSEIMEKNNREKVGRN
ncbi:MAG: dynamin family protein [Candidatus Cloacimonadia bacterium]